MADALLNPHWYRVADVKLKMRSHMRTHRHIYRGKVWYVLRDETTGKHHRYNEATYRFVRLIDGERSVNDIWEHLCDQYGDEAPTQDDVMQLLGSLYFADSILGDLPGDVEEMIERRIQQRKKLFLSKLMNPMSIRIPLIDPDRFLTRCMGFVRPLFSKFAISSMLLLMLWALIEAWRNWSSISQHATEVALQPSNLLILVLVYPLVKGLHELGHAFAVKRWGGEVHELGIMLLVFMPVPYVDASAATAYRNKYRRMAVALAGIFVELLLASIALLLWLNVQAGLVSDILFNIMLIGGVSTLLFNGNPLLRFDGYYALADAVEIPGLAARSNKYLLYLIQRHVFAMKQASSPETAAGERVWFVVYGLASFAYRMFIMVTIVLFIANQYFFIGTALACWLVFMQVIKPVFKGAQFVLQNPALSSNRRRAIVASLVSLCIFLLALFSVPMPLNTTAEGVVWMPEKSYIRACSDGFVTSVEKTNGQQVDSGEVAIVTEDITLIDELDLMRAELAETQSRYDAIRQDDLVQAKIIQDELKIKRGKVKHLQERLSELKMKTPAGGTFVIPTSQQLEGQYVKQGDNLAYVINFDELSVRVAVPQNAIGLVRKHTESVELRMAGAISEVYPSSVIREIPAATYRLPSKALSVAGGGSIQTDPFDQEGVRTHDQYFQFDLSLPEHNKNALIGQRVYVKFSHGYEALATQWYRAFSELFLDELGKV